jgi:two-component system, response regulator PdtaR
MPRKIKILIVEDEALTATSLKLDLEEFGAEVLKPVAKGDDAIKVALEEKPSIILMDIRLAGGLDGIETAEEIHCHQNTPILFMTGFITDYIKNRAHKIKPIGFLEKPVNINDVYTILNTFKTTESS